MMQPWSRQLAPAMAARGRVSSSALDGLGDGVGEGRVGGDEDGLGALVVFGLGEEVDGDVGRVWAASARMTTSEGPAMLSMPTRPKTWRLASAT